MKRCAFIFFALGIVLGGCSGFRSKHFINTTPFPYDTSGIPENVAQRWQDLWNHTVNISLIRLISAPRDFDRIPVRVTGIIATTEFGVLLFLDRDSYTNFLTENAVNIVLHESYLDHEMLPSIEGKYVRVVGEFRDEHAGRYFINGQLYNVLPIKPGHVLRQVESTHQTHE